MKYWVSTLKEHLKTVQTCLNSVFIDILLSISDYFTLRVWEVIMNRIIFMFYVCMNNILKSKDTTKSLTFFHTHAYTQKTILNYNKSQL